MTIDPTVEASKVLTRARYLAGQAVDELAIRRVAKMEEQAHADLLESYPATVRGVFVHLLEAERERRLMEEHAAGWARDYRREAPADAPCLIWSPKLHFRRSGQGAQGRTQDPPGGTAASAPATGRPAVATPGA